MIPLGEPEHGMYGHTATTQMTHFADEFNQVEPTSSESPTTCTFKRYPIDACLPCPTMPDNLAQSLIDNAKRQRWLDTCARCGSDHGIERNLGYKINICDECWGKTC